MTKNELFKHLARFDGDAEIEIVIHQYDKTYPIAYVGISDLESPVTESPHYQGPDKPKDIRISVHLPEDMRTRTLKKSPGQMF